MSRRAGFPLASPGQTIGLLGGSFDPPHAGHVHITKAALARFGLDRVWWLVSPANPLKGDGPAPMAQRLAAARETMDHPRVEITDIEARLGTRYTVQTLRALRRRYPGVRFVWLMGADNLGTIHRWDSWQEIFRLVPVGVLARPGQGRRARWSTAARRFAGARLRPAEARALPRAVPPAWCFLPLPMRDISSTAIRARGEWPR